MARSRMTWHPINCAVLETYLLFFGKNGPFFGRKIQYDHRRYAVVDQARGQDDLLVEGSDVYPTHWAPVPEKPGPHNVSPKPKAPEFEPGFKRRMDWSLDKRDGVC